jgi:hypothetical protein
MNIPADAISKNPPINMALPFVVRIVYISSSLCEFLVTIEVAVLPGSFQLKTVTGVVSGCCGLSAARVDSAMKRRICAANCSGTITLLG